MVKGRGASSGRAEATGPGSLGGGWCDSQEWQSLEDIGLGAEGPELGLERKGEPGIHPGYFWLQDVAAGRIKGSCWEGSTPDLGSEGVAGSSGQVRTAVCWAGESSSSLWASLH